VLPRSHIYVARSESASAASTESAAAKPSPAKTAAAPSRAGTAGARRGHERLMRIDRYGPLADLALDGGFAKAKMP